MTTQSTVIFESGFFTACAMSDGSLIVQNKKTGKGSRLIGENAPHWIDNIKTAIDKKEANMLCRAVAG